MLLVLLAWAGQGYASPDAAAVSGVVRDVHGTPQMGALVELLTVDASTVASAITDDHGRYILAAVNPGKYQLRATAAFFVPATRTNLSLHAGAQAIINLTMTTLFEAANWLPAERRAADEPADDWKWTLRSTAGRPLLRLVDPEDGTEMSASASEVRRAETQARVAVVNGDGAFGDGGMHQVLTMDRVLEDGDGAILRADLGDPQSPLTVAPAVDILAGYERQLPLGGRTRLVAGFASHPEVMAQGVPGFEVMRLASAEQVSLGDAVLIDAGTLLAAERLEATRLTRVMSEPYVRVMVHPSQDMAIEYHYATGRMLQSAEDLDRMKPETAPLADGQGRIASDRGSHHEAALSRKLGDDDAITLAVYHDEFEHGVIAGSGAVNAAAMDVAALVSDPTTLTFRLTTPAYSGRGVSVAISHNLSPTLKATLTYQLGTALRTCEMGAPIDAIAPRGHNTSAASLTLHGRIVATGTSVNAGYRWQPVSTLTQVDPYDVSPQEAYLSFAIRQRIWGGRFLPHGMDAVVEATNLLEQGYQPVLAPDGHTLFLAQVPRAIQGGLAFNF